MYEISADGRYVAIVSNASNLVAGDTNRLADSFIKDTLDLAQREPRRAARLSLQTRRHDKSYHMESTVFPRGFRILPKVLAGHCYQSRSREGAITIGNSVTLVVKCLNHSVDG